MPSNKEYDVGSWCLNRWFRLRKEVAFGLTCCNRWRLVEMKLIDCVFFVLFFFFFFGFYCFFVLPQKVLINLNRNEVEITHHWWILEPNSKNCTNLMNHLIHCVLSNGLLTDDVKNDLEHSHSHFYMHTKVSTGYCHSNRTNLVFKHFLIIFCCVYQWRFVYQHHEWLHHFKHPQMDTKRCTKKKDAQIILFYLLIE